MAREYVVGGDGLTITGASTLSFVNPGSAPGPMLEFYEAWVSQRGTATIQQLGVQLEQQVTAFPTLTSKTPQIIKKGDPASQITGGTAGAAGTSGINASAEGAGAKTILVPDNFNNLNGWHWGPWQQGAGPCLYARAGDSFGIGLFLPLLPTTLTGWSWGLAFREIG